jgi:hypothetical protein
MHSVHVLLAPGCHACVHQGSSTTAVQLQYNCSTTAMAWPHRGDVGVVPCVVVHDDRPVAHCSDLVPVVPPAHDAGIRLGVVPQPVVRLSEVVQDVPGAGGAGGMSARQVARSSQMPRCKPAASAPHVQPCQCLLLVTSRSRHCASMTYCNQVRATHLEHRPQHCLLTALV